MPEVSVVIPSYNSAAYLPQAVDSVLAQTFRDVEVLVIDDGSTDDTAAVMGRYGEPVRYIRQPNGGVSRARNRGIEESRGRYVAFLDADDTWFPQKLERQLSALDGKTDYRVCYSGFVRVDSNLAPLGVHRGNPAGATLAGLLTQGNQVGSICTVLVDRSLFDRTGGFDPQLSQCADWDMWVRLAVHTPFLYVDESLVTYRQHGENMSRSAPLLERDSVRVLEKGFAMPELPAAVRARQSAAFAWNWMVLAGCYYHARRWRDFFRCVARSLALDLRQARYLLQFPARLWQRRRTPQTGGA